MVNLIKENGKSGEEIARGDPGDPSVITKDMVSLTFLHDHFLKLRNPHRENMN